MSNSWLAKDQIDFDKFGTGDTKAWFFITKLSSKISIDQSKIWDERVLSLSAISPLMAQIRNLVIKKKIK